MFIIHFNSHLFKFLALFVMKRRYDDDSLCCCEYINRDGRRAHLLGCLCDCSAVDELAERCVTCRPVNREYLCNNFTYKFAFFVYC